MQLKKQIGIVGGIVLLALFGCANIEGEADESDLDVVVLHASQNDDFTLLEYTIEASHDLPCDIKGVKVEVTAKAKSDSTSIVMEHNLGRVKKKKTKQLSFEVDSSGKEVHLDDVKIRTSDAGEYKNCEI